MTPVGISVVIASEAKQSISPRVETWIASSHALLAMTVVRVAVIFMQPSLPAQPLPHPCVGVGVLSDVGNDSDGIGAGGENLG